MTIIVAQLLALTPVITARNNIYLLDEAQKTRCVILMGKMYLSLAICNEAMDTVYLVQHFQSGTKALTRNGLQSILSQEEIKKSNSVLVGMDSYKTTLIPFKYYKEEFKEDYFRFFEEHYADEDIQEHNITDSLVELYSVKRATKTLLQTLLNQPTLVSSSAVLLRHYPNSFTIGKAHQFFIAVKDDTVILSYYYNEVLQLHQLYSFTQEMDVVYYVCNVLHVRSIEAAQCSVQLHGEHAAVTRIHDLLKQHVEQVKYCNRIRGLHYPDSLYTQPTHYFYNLFALLSCVS